METVVVERKLLKNFANDLEHLLYDFERLLDVSLNTKAEKRLNELKSGKVNGASEEEYLKLIKKLGVKNV